MRVLSWQKIRQMMLFLRVKLKGTLLSRLLSMFATQRKGYIRTDRQMLALSTAAS
jgi:hypothetical protein